MQVLTVCLSCCRTPSRFEPPLGILNAPLLCEHGGLQVDVGLNDVFLVKETDYE